MSIMEVTRNHGSAPASPSVTAYYLARDPSALIREQSLAAARAVPGLEVDGESETTTEITIPASIPSGAYFVVACAEFGDHLTIVGERNNCRASATLVHIQP